MACHIVLSESGKDVLCMAIPSEDLELIKAGWDVGVAWQDGRPFHGEYSIRINLALPLSRVKEAFDRLDQYVINA